MINTTKLRKVIGWLGMLLPWIVAALYFVYVIIAHDFENILNRDSIKPFLIWLCDSISMTYHIPTCITPFMIILGAASLLLITYEGYDKQDNIVCSIAGICGLCICLFPCSNIYINIPDNIGAFLLPKQISGILHNVAAVIFFLLLSYNSFFLFTKSSGEMTDEKRKRNIIFRVCGIGMIVSLIAILPGFIFQWYGWTWLIEMIVLSFFGISWLTKSQCYSWLFKDRD